ncbi:hypothetical protein D0501_05610 [Leuconostoc holzapfelii]|uniref:Uncharacterized protein n=1 Tax=Leuconostoc holzapfelii TaxID=434464 RepID=A0ABT2NVZ1_9LACO|nr:hypothetical protein [Leuconostoc holzapfelii]MCT8389548.1 hypothetical protein [Leuconostoc holzapfelii]
MIIHDLERNDVEIAIAKVNEALKLVNELAANSVDDSFVAEMDVKAGELTELAGSLRTTIELSNVIDFSEYYDRYLRK